MRNALYGRQSLDKKDSISIETQIEKGRAECAADDVILIYEDRGFSGKNTKRPDFQRLMNDVEKGLIDRVIVYKLDRFSRSILDFAKAWDILAKNHVEFISINEKFDTSTPLGKAMLYISIVFAQMERETIAERVKDNYYERLKRGSWMGGPAPYGYLIGRQQSITGAAIPTLVQGENIDIVREIYETYAGDMDMSLGAIAARLIKRNIPGPKRITWNNVTLARMIRNPAYVKANADIYAYYKSLGVRVVNHVNEFNGDTAGILVGKRGADTRKRKEIQEAAFALASWEGTISSDVWLTCQNKLAANEQIKNSGKGKYTWLSGLMKCGACKRAFRIIVDPKYPDNKKLYCSGRIDKICTYITTLHVNEVEKYVQQELIKVLEECNNEPAEEEPVISNTYKILLKEIEEKAENLISNLSSSQVGEVTIRFINSELERLEKEREELLKELQEKSQVRKVQYESVNFPELGMEEKKIVANSYVECVEVTDESIWIKWRI